MNFIEAIDAMKKGAWVKPLKEDFVYKIGGFGLEIATATLFDSEPSFESTWMWREIQGELNVPLAWFIKEWVIFREG